MYPDKNLSAARGKNGEFNMVRITTVFGAEGNARADREGDVALPQHERVLRE